MKRLERISCHNFVEINGNIYFSNWFYNGLFKVEYETGKTTFLGYFNDEKLTEKNIHLEVFLEEQKIYFLPRRGRHIHIYDLSDAFIQSIEIRKDSDEFDVIIDVMKQDNCLIFFPFKNKFPIKKLDMTTLKVTDIDSKQKLRGKYLSKEKDCFPAVELLEKYDISGRKYFSWKKMPNGKWCGFMPMEAQILYYIEGIPKLEIIPLTVVNGQELEEYLCRLKPILIKEGSVQESQKMHIRQFEEEFIDVSISNENNFKYNNIIGKEIWEKLKRLI